MATMDALVVAYLLLVLLTLVAAGLWAYARGVESSADDSAGEQAIDLAALTTLREHAPCGILQLNDAYEIARPISATTRRILRQPCEVGSPFADSLSGVAAADLIVATNAFLTTLRETREPTAEFLASNPLARLVLNPCHRGGAAYCAGSCSVSAA
jgi:hypothetical protein